MKDESARCPVCAKQGGLFFSTATDVEYFSTNDSYTYLECPGCAAIYLRDPPVESLREIYPDTYYAVDGPSIGGNPLTRLLLSVKGFLDKRLYASLLRKIPGRELACLDIGGGSGWMMSLVRASDTRVVRTAVLDLNENSRSLAEQNGHRFLNCQVEALEATAEYDFILMLNLIEHVASPGQVLVRIRQALTANGVCLIKTPNTRSVDRLLFRRHYWGGLHAPRHWVLFNEENFTRLAGACGLAVESFKYTQGAPQWVASVLGSIEKYWPSKRRVLMHRRPAATLLTLVFVALDLLLLPFGRTDQMFFVLKQAPRA